MSYTLEDLDKAIIECSGVSRTNMENIQSLPNWDGNRPVWLKLCVFNLWMNSIPSNSDKFTKLIHFSLNKLEKEGTII